MSIWPNRGDGLRPRLARSPWTRPAIGIEASDAWLHVAQLRPSRKGPQWRYAMTALPAEPPTGRAQSTMALRDDQDGRQIEPGKAFCALCSPAIDVFPLNLKETDSTPLDAAVVSGAKARLSYPIEQAVLDYMTLPDSACRANAGKSVLVFSVSRTHVESLLERLDRAGLIVDRIVTPAFAIAHQLAKGGDETRRIVIAAGEDTTSISVIEHGHVLLERIIPWGVQRLAERVGSTLDLDTDHAHELVRGNSETQGPRDERVEGALKEILMPAFQDLATETSSCLGYCTSFLKHRPIESVLLVGRLSGHADLRSFLQDELGLLVSSPRDSSDEGVQPRFPLSATHAVAASCAAWMAEEAA